MQCREYFYLSLILHKVGSNKVAAAIKPDNFLAIGFPELLTIVMQPKFSCFCFDDYDT